MTDFSSNILLLNIALFLLGLIGLIKGSSFFIDAAAYIAREFKVSEIVIGLTLVSVGTSLPELATDVYAAFQGQGAVVQGDLIGSNITNITLILGLAVLLGGGLSVPKAVMKRDALFLLIVFALFDVIVWLNGGYLSRSLGILLLLIMLAYLIYLFKHRNVLAELEEGEEHNNKDFSSIKVAFAVLAGGLLLILLGAKVMVDNVVEVAMRFGLNKGVIAATIVAFGTSVPELAVTVGGILKKRQAIALGNIVGSCIFNLVLIMGLCLVIHPSTAQASMLWINMPVMLLSGAILCVVMRSGWRIVRMEAILLLFIYILFLAFNATMVGSHGAI